MRASAASRRKLRRWIGTLSVSAGTAVFSGALPGVSGSLRRHLYRQAERVAAWIADPQATWTGLSWR